ncbi:MAG: GIY-YIG nuclease family protein [Patescibacteria group bacterium]|nr:GIY-YIG nuclease family protein [Patescibacteria group bacterium]
MKYFVYLLKSLRKNYYYVGLTNNLKRRISQHNSSKVRSTKHYQPFKLVFTKEFSDRIRARDFEKFLKIRSNKEKVIASLN